MGPVQQSLITAIADYRRRWPREAPVVERFTALLEHWPRCLRREHLPGHFTASGWVVHPGSDAVLLTHHRKLDKWLQLGGHVDGDTDVVRAARREVEEESGLVAFDLVSDPLIFDMDVHGIPRHGEVPPHDHYDLRFAFVARHRHEPVVSDESHDVAWVSLGELERYTTEPAMLRMRAKWRHRGSQVLNRGE